jgi:hypothetical protein
MTFALASRVIGLRSRASRAYGARWLAPFLSRSVDTESDAAPLYAVSHLPPGDPANSRRSSPHRNRHYHDVPRNSALRRLRRG